MDFNNNNNNNMDVADAYSPAMSDFSDMDDDELDLYLANCGRLSSLPTPPPPSHHRITVPAFASPPALQTPPPEPQVARHFSELQVYATHLVGLVQQDSKSGDDVEVVEVVEAFLERAGLPVAVVAFAACILERLSGSRDMEAIIVPELSILASLSLAQGYLSDRGRSNCHWAVIEAAGRFEGREVQRAKMGILQDIDFRLFSISPEEVVAMEKALQRDLPLPLVTTMHGITDQLQDELRPKLALASGTPGQAIWTHGVQTPEPSP